MAVGGISTTTLGLADPSTLAAGSSARPASALSTFGRVIDDFMATKARDEAQVDQAIKDLALGNSTEFHTVALTMAKADIHFRMGLEIRNKLTDAYQEVMRMQI